MQYIVQLLLIKEYGIFADCGNFFVFHFPSIFLRLSSNRLLVKDLDAVTCSSPQHFKGRKIVDADVASVCSKSNLSFRLNFDAIF